MTNAEALKMLAEEEKRLLNFNERYDCEKAMLERTGLSAYAEGVLMYRRLIYNCKARIEALHEKLGHLQ